MDLYENPGNYEQAENNQKFRAFMNEYPHVKFFRPSPEKAPWHVQCSFESKDGFPVVVNFWPHKAKAQRDGEHSVEGFENFDRIIQKAMDDAETKDFDVIE